jgi:hypothetical protein
MLYNATLTMEDRIESIFTDLFSIFTTTDGTSETTAKAVFWGGTPFGLNKTGGFSKKSTNRIGILTSQDIKQNSAKGTE